MKPPHRPDGALPFTALLTSYVWLPCVLADSKLAAFLQHETTPSPHWGDPTLSFVCRLSPLQRYVSRRHQTCHRAPSHRPFGVLAFTQVILPFVSRHSYLIYSGEYVLAF